MVEAIVFVGVPGIGKSTYYKKYHFKTHIRVNRDMLREYNYKQKLVNGVNYEEKMMNLIKYCIDNSVNFVVDNNNFTKKQRKHLVDYIRLMDTKEQFKIIALVFPKDFTLASGRNLQRGNYERVPYEIWKSMVDAYDDVSMSEGFDKIRFL